MRAPLVLLLRLYRGFVSPWLPARCRFHPTCSAYALEAVERFGAGRGTLLTLWRLLRCHPLAPGGFDPVPAAFGLRAFGWRSAATWEPHTGQPASLSDPHGN